MARKTIDASTEMENEQLKKDVSYRGNNRKRVLTAHFMDIIMINQQWLMDISDDDYESLLALEDFYYEMGELERLAFKVKCEGGELSMDELLRHGEELAKANQIENDSKKGKKKKLARKELLNILVKEDPDQENVVTTPVGLNKRQVAEELLRQWEAEEKIVDKTQIFSDFHSDDALVNVMRTLNDEFGWINSKATYGPFGQKFNPNIFQIPTNFGKSEPCFTGDFDVVSWEGTGHVGNTPDGKTYVTFSIKRRYESRAERFFERVLANLKVNSIYLNKNVTYQNGKFKYFRNNPVGDIILNEKEQMILDNFVMKPIENNLPLKRGILLTGPYGTGKTETAMRIGDFAQKHGFTFIYSKEDANIDQLLEMAVRYAPVVVFIEDIDEFTSSAERDRHLNSILNTLDGIETKNHAVHTIMTTNNENKIHQSLRRPGRIDVVMKFDYPEHDAIIRMYKHFFDGVAGMEKLDYDALAQATPGELQGAFIQEIAKRAVWLVNDEKGEVLTNEIVLSSIALAEMQIGFMKGDQDTGDSGDFENAFHDMVANNVQVKKLDESIEFLKEQLT